MSCYQHALSFLCLWHTNKHGINFFIYTLRGTGLLCFAVGLSCFANPINSLSWRCICGTQDAERKFVSQSSRPFHLLNHLIKNESKSETNQGSYDLELRQSIFSDSFCSVKLGWASPVRKTANIRPDDIDIVSNSLLWMLLLDRHNY